ncbi:MAG: hypothetical protein HYU43_00940 [Armatimonadetes bacterium]|nr:hypothetical protein [Armatimonadota bacterium]
MTVPPRMDGTIDPEEWREATAVSGVVDCQGDHLVPRPTTFYLAWDAEHLYWACRAWVMPGYKPCIWSGRSPHTAGVGDDGPELHFQPLGKNVTAGRTESSYKFFVNCLGFTGDYMRCSVGQQFKNWLPSFKTAARLTEPGTAPRDGRWWECEVSASLEDFELGGPHRPGDRWRMMLGFNHMPGWCQARIPCNGGYFNPDGYSLGTLVENTPAVQVLMEDLPGPCDGQPAATFRIFNPRKDVARMDLLAEFGKDLQERASLLVEPGKTAELKIRHPGADTLDSGHLFYQVKEGDQELFRTFAYFKAGYPENWVKHSPPPKGSFPLTATFNPVRSNLFIQVDAYFLDRPEDAVEVPYAVRKEGIKGFITSGVIRHPHLSRFQELMNLPVLSEGSYEVEAFLVMKDGQKLGPQRTKFSKLNEAKAFAEWWDKDLGNIERVIPPFEPIRREGAEVDLWGRAYRLNALGLPDDIRSQNAPVLDGPARIVVGAGGAEKVISLAGRPAFTQTRPWRVDFEGKAKGAGLEFRSQGWIEQDGLLWLETTFMPAGNKPVRIDALRLEFPIRGDQAECLVCLGTGGNYAARTTTVIPPEKNGLLWTTLDTGRVGSMMAVGSFYPCVWIGSERRGLLWWADNDKGWVPHNDVPAHQVVRQGGQVVLRNNIIGQSFDLEQPRTLALSLMASPFRPLVKNWRMALGSWDGTFSGGESWGYKWRKDPKTGGIIEGWNWLTPPSKNPAEWGAIWSEYKKKADEKVRQEQPCNPCQARNWMFVHTSLPLVGYGWKSPDEKVSNYFGPEWGSSEAYPDTNIRYYLYLADRAFREGGLRTIYWDIFFPTLHSTIQNGMAYTLPDGGIQPGYAGWNTRRFLMRMYALMQDHGLTPGAQVSHATNDYLLVACGWMDAILDGEYHKLTDESAMDWVDGYPLDRMRSLSCPENWGVVISWMDHIHLMDEERRQRYARGLVEYVQLFDSWQGPSQGRPPLEVLGAQFVPFWRNPYIQCGDPDILTSLWLRQDYACRVMLSVFNSQPKETKGSVKLKLDLDALGLRPKLKWQEFIHLNGLDEKKQERFDFYEGTVELHDLSPHRGRQIGLARY